MTTKKEGFRNRQKDTGWGYAIAHLLPFVFIYYALTRRTITPLLYAVLGNIAVGFCYGFIYAFVNPNYEEKNLEDSATLLGLVMSPILTKKGIDQARMYGKYELDLD